MSIINSRDYEIGFTGPCINAYAIVEAVSVSHANYCFNTGRIIKEPLWIAQKRKEDPVAMHYIRRVISEIPKRCIVSE